MAEAPVGARAAAWSREEWELDAQKLQRLRELRAEIQDLQSVLGHVRRGEATHKTYADYYRRTLSDIDEIMQGIQDGDSIRHLQNLWEQVRACPLLLKPEEDLSAQEQLHHLNTLDAQFRQIIYQVGALTIPARLNEWLANARPGYYIPFHAVFDDELPNWEDRERLLNLLAWSPMVIEGGIVDAANGLIYRHAREPIRIVGSILLLVLAVAVAIGIVIGACYLPVEAWPLQPRHVSTALIGWAAVLVGVLVHGGVGTVKRAQTQGGRPPILAVGDLPRVINAKVGQILLKLLLTLVGFFGLVFATGVENTTPLNTFLIGYSLDSVVELFSASIEQQAARQVTMLKQQLGVKTEA